MRSSADLAGLSSTPPNDSAPDTPPGEILRMSKADPLRAIEMVAEGVVVIALLAELVLVLANVFDRACFRRSFLWTDEAARLALSILAFIGGAVAYRRRDHAFVRVVLNLVAPSVERTCLVFSDIVVVFVVGLVGIASAQFLTSSWGELTPVLQVPAAFIALPLPVGMTLIALFAVDNLYRRGMRLSR
jgi:TRAP-type C4-dicarboxylate transport system permease small subunit